MNLGQRERCAAPEKLEEWGVSANQCLCGFHTVVADEGPLKRPRVCIFMYMYTPIQTTYLCLKHAQ